MSFDPYTEEGNKLIQGWMREFDLLYQKQENYNSSVKYVTIEEKRMTIDEFLNYKLENIS